MGFIQSLPNFQRMLQGPQMGAQPQVAQPQQTQPTGGYLASLFGKKFSRINPMSMFGGLINKVGTGVGGMFAPPPSGTWGAPQQPIPRTPNQTPQPPVGPGMKTSYQPQFWGNAGAAPPYDPNAVQNNLY